MWGATAGVVRGVVHDPHHRPIANATVRLQSVGSDLKQTAESDANGEFRFVNLMAGRYRIVVAAVGFRSSAAEVTVGSSATEVLHFPLEVATKGEQVNVTASTNEEAQPTTPERVVTRAELESIPSATRADSLAIITNTIPGAMIVHNQLHVRGGHEFLWMVDGVPLPNTNIASNVGPLFDPKDMEAMDIQRGSLNAEFGDRASAIFNVVPKVGFDRSREAQLTLGMGSENSTDDQLSFGDHSEKLAYYGSVGGTRTDAGLEPPIARVLHDQRSGVNGMGSVIYNATSKDQVRVTSGARRDWFQVPNTEERQAAGGGDTDVESDAYGIASWMHTVSPSLATTVSPFYHYNSAEYRGTAGDTALIPHQERGSNYIGVHSTASYSNGTHDVRAGLLAMGQHDNQAFSISDGVSTEVASRKTLWGNEVALFAEDQWRATPWLTMSGGVRFTRFSGNVDEHAVDPRVGAAVRIPRVGIVLRGFYGRYYQAPPLLTVDGPTLAVAATEGFTFLPLQGERDEQMEFGASVPIRGWTVDGDYFVTRARNFFDHDALGNSNIFFPLTIARARIRGWETSVHSPDGNRVRVGINYSHQFVEGLGSTSGGLVSFEPPPEGFYFLDHDQRDTVTGTVSARLPWRAMASVAITYGSGFLDGDGPQHLPDYATVDISARKQIRERWTVGLTASNVGNSRHLIDQANTFGGTHVALPREVYGEVRFRWKY
jgi:TonB dependent receptor/Carboxypeptidase regulatory-like domain/TonB-dependent Receptor Plug Domain